MQKSRNIHWHMALLLVAALMIGTSGAALAQQPIRWASSSLGSGSQALLTVVINVVNRADPGLKIVEQTTTGPIENMRLLNQGKADLGHLVFSDIYNGSKGRGIYASQGPTNILGLFTTYPAVGTFAVRAESDIHTIEDLKGKRISIGPAGAGVSTAWTAWLKAYGIYDKAKIIKLGYREGADALRNRSVDATYVYGVGDTPTAFTQELDLAIKLRLLEWDVSGEGFARLKRDAPEMACYGPLPKGMSRSLDRDITAFVNWCADYAVGSLSEEAGYRIVKGIWENREKILSANKLSKWMLSDPAHMLKGMDIPEVPIHPGAARFYKEVGVWTGKANVGTLK